MQTVNPPAAYFLESFDNAIEMWPLFWIIIPAVHHQLNVLRLHFRERNVGTEWRILVCNDALNDHCVGKSGGKSYIPEYASRN